jgi:hypothetical protein
MLASSRDGKYLDAIEKITGNKLPSREMMDIEVREEARRPREGGRGGRDKDRNRGRDGKQRDRRPPGGKYHDQVASTEPTEAGAAPAPQQPRQEQPRQEAPRQEQPRQEQQPRREDKPRNEPRPEQRQEQRHEHHRGEKRERGSQRQHNERAARPEAVDKSELPAFLFRPVPVKKPEPQN